jgi:hypothetical protein
VEHPDVVKVAKQMGVFEHGWSDQAGVDPLSVEHPALAGLFKSTGMDRSDRNLRIVSLPDTGVP